MPETANYETAASNTVFIRIMSSSRQT